jgi:hypothetical protein
VIEIPKPMRIGSPDWAAAVFTAALTTKTAASSLTVIEPAIMCSSYTPVF